VIIGHSERRKWLHETDAMVAKKVRAALEGGLNVIMCVGEPAPVRKKGLVAAERYLAKQINVGLSEVPARTKGRVIIAYEPIWAIGSGKNDDPRDAARIAAFIRKTAGRGTKVLYGGSVNGGDAGGYVQLKQIDGALIGGASLKAAELKKIITAFTKS
jgi:triosephosphate isomerase